MEDATSALEVTEVGAVCSRAGKGGWACSDYFEDEQVEASFTDFPTSFHSNSLSQSTTATDSVGTSQSSLASPGETDSSFSFSSSRTRKRVGPFHVGKLLGKGVTGQVYQGIHENGFKVALKVINKKQMANHEAEIRREVSILKVVDHPYICKLYDVIDTQKRLYIVFEYVPGGELFDYVIGKGHLSRAESLRILAQTAMAVEHLHSLGICHRDIKPSNILMDSQGNVKLADLGLATIIPKGALLGTRCGSPHYVSPEVVLGQEYDGRLADVWSLGVLLYAMRTGSLPFNNSNIPRLLYQISVASFEVPDCVEPDVSDLIGCFLKKDPKARILLTQLHRHPAYRNQGCVDVFLSKPLASSRKKYTSSSSASCANPRIDEKTVKDIASFGCFGDEAHIYKELLLLDQPLGDSPIRAMYHLLLRRKARRVQELQILSPKLKQQQRDSNRPLCAQLLFNVKGSPEALERSLPIREKQQQENRTPNEARPPLSCLNRIHSQPAGPPPALELQAGPVHRTASAPSAQHCSPSPGATTDLDGLSGSFAQTPNLSPIRNFNPSPTSNSPSCPSEQTKQDGTPCSLDSELSLLQTFPLVSACSSVLDLEPCTGPRPADRSGLLDRSQPNLPARLTRSSSDSSSSGGKVECTVGKQNSQDQLAQTDGEPEARSVSVRPHKSVVPLAEVERTPCKTSRRSSLDFISFNKPGSMSFLQRGDCKSLPTSPTTTPTTTGMFHCKSLGDVTITSTDKLGRRMPSQHQHRRKASSPIPILSNSSPTTAQARRFELWENSSRSSRWQMHFRNISNDSNISIDMPSPDCDSATPGHSWFQSTYARRASLSPDGVYQSAKVIAGQNSVSGSPRFPLFPRRHSISNVISNLDASSVEQPTPNKNQKLRYHLSGLTRMLSLTTLTPSQRSPLSAPTPTDGA